MLAKLSGGRLLAVAVSAVAVQLAVFKLLYPYASYFFTDSFSYLMAAGSDQDIATWPIGYSRFLRVFNTFIQSDTGLVCAQYLILQAGGLCLLKTLDGIFSLRPLVFLVLFAFIMINPLSLYLANSISGDAIFTGLSFFWLSVLLRMVHSRSRKLILVHAFLLAMIFTIRYNAIYYPFAAGAVIAMSAYSRRQKILAIVLPVLLIAGFMTYTAGAFRQAAGVYTFSPFGGWQMANNALYAYAHVPREERVGVPAEYMSLDSVVRQHFDTARQRSLSDDDQPGIWYLWQSQSPLVQHALSHQAANGGYFRAWSAVGPLYAGYGAWLVRQYPAAFGKYFLWPNMIRYAMPPLEFMNVYNSGVDTVEPVAQYWFGYKDASVGARVGKTIQASILKPYQVLHMVVNLFFALILIIYFRAREIRAAYPKMTRYLLPGIFCWLLNMVFVTVTAPVVLRYEVFPMTVCVAFSLSIVDGLRAAGPRGLRGPATGPLRAAGLLADISVFSLCFLFVYAATAKLFRFKLFLFQLQSYPWIGDMATWVAWGVPLIELAIACLLLSRKSRPAGLLASLVLMIVFTIYLAAMLGSGGHLPCSCGGVIESLSWRQHIWFNLLFVVLAATGLYIHHHKTQVYET